MADRNRSDREAHKALQGWKRLESSTPATKKTVSELLSADDDKAAELKARIAARKGGTTGPTGPTPEPEPTPTPERERGRPERIKIEFKEESVIPRDQIEQVYQDLLDPMRARFSKHALRRLLDDPNPVTKRVVREVIMAGRLYGETARINKDLAARNREAINGPLAQDIVDAGLETGTWNLREAEGEMRTIISELRREPTAEESSTGTSKEEPATVGPTKEVEDVEEGPGPDEAAEAALQPVKILIAKAIMDNPNEWERVSSAYAQDVADQADSLVKAGRLSAEDHDRFVMGRANDDHVESLDRLESYLREQGYTLVPEDAPESQAMSALAGVLVIRAVSWDRPSPDEPSPAHRYVDDCIKRGDLKDAISR